MFGSKQTQTHEQLIARGAELSATGRLEEALYCFERALRLEPDSIIALMRRGNALVKLGRTDEALLCYQRIIDVDPDNAKAFFNKGCAIVNKGRLLSPSPFAHPPYPEAIASFEQAQRLGIGKAAAVLEILNIFAQHAPEPAEPAKTALNSEGVVLVPED